MKLELLLDVVEPAMVSQQVPPGRFDQRKRPLSAAVLEIFTMMEIDQIRLTIDEIPCVDIQHGKRLWSTKT